jgi:hypothetical protein
MALLIGMLPPLPAAAFAPAPPPLLLAGVDVAFMPALPALEPPAGAAVPPAGVFATWFGCAPWLGVMPSGVLLPHAEHARHARPASQRFTAIDCREICIELSRKQPATGPANVERLPRLVRKAQPGCATHVPLERRMAAGGSANILIISTASILSSVNPIYS